LSLTQSLLFYLAIIVRRFAPLLPHGGGGRVTPLMLIPYIGPYGASHKIMTLVSSNASDRSEENYDKL